MSSEAYYQKLEKIRLLEQKKRLKHDLPHKHSFNYYQWQLDHINEVNRYCFTKAGNQLGKSICNGVKWLTLATEPTLWEKFFTKRTPRQFWILMPTRDIINTEWTEKWLPEFMPKGAYKDHPQYGWEEEIKNKNLWAIHFKTGITCYTHTYEQDVHHLQAGTIDAHFVDEELPYDLYGELNMRLQAVDGQWNMVYTPTRGEPQWMRLWYKGRKETFKDSFKQEISLFDCMKYADGTRSHWSEEQVNRVLNSLGTDAEIQLRVHGKNSKPEGLKLAAFDPERNVNIKTKVPASWLWYSGIDIGTGGPKNHPASISFIAVRPDYRMGRLVRCWRGGPEKVTSHTDIADKWFEMKEELGIVGELEGNYYDWQAKDFEITATAAGIPLMKAEKSHEVGYPLLNTLFKNQMLDVDDTEENQDFVEEALSLKSRTSKTVAKDDAIDSCRYGTSRIPWDLSHISGKEVIQLKKQLSDLDYRRRGQNYEDPDEQEEAVDQEIDYWNELYEA